MLCGESQQNQKVLPVFRVCKPIKKFIGHASPHSNTKNWWESLRTVVLLVHDQGNYYNSLEMNEIFLLIYKY